MLVTHFVKLACAAAILVLDVVVYSQHRERHYSLIGLGMDAAFLLVAAVLALYALLTYCRLSSASDYAHPANFKPYGFNDGSTTGRPSMDQFPSWQSLPRLSFSSNRDDRASTHSAPRSPSVYNHQRDTSFDEYLAAAGYGKLDVPTVTVTDTTHHRSRSLSLGHSPSYRSDAVLTAVPEEDDELPAMNPHPKASSAEMEASSLRRPALTHGWNRSVSYESKLNADARHGSSIGCPPVPQMVDLTDSKWEPVVL
jgi:hypothetical protein